MKARIQPENRNSHAGMTSMAPEARIMNTKMNTKRKKIVPESVREKVRNPGAVGQPNGIAQGCSRPPPVNTFGGSTFRASAVALGVVISSLGMIAGAYSATLAFDNANLPEYATQPNHNWSVINGGYGYNLWTGLNDIPLGTGMDGGTYMTGVGVELRQVDADWSFGLYAYGTGFYISRPLATPMAEGIFTILTRFDMTGGGANLINLRSANGTAAFTSGELLAFGIDGDADPTQLSFRDATGIHVLPSGEARREVWQWTVNFNALSGIYSLWVTNLGGGFATTLGGHLKENLTTVGSFAVRNSSIGDYQNLIFDGPAFDVPPFATTGALTSVRAGHSATLLRNGTVLVVGGFNGTIRLATSELYNPAAGVWTPSGKMAIGRTLHTATLLSNGRVLVTGGHFTATGSSPTCELYDPASGTWTETGVMSTARGNHTATLLRNGKVLVAGGFNRNTASVVSTAELYDPGTGTWTAAGSLANARENQTATLLLNGKVLVVGGAPDNLQFHSLSSVEVYDPDAGSWTTNNPMSSARQIHTATLLPDGRVLVAGGGDVGYFTSSAEIYDPASGTWTATGPLGTSRGVHSATLLPDGKVLAVGGNHNSLAAPTLVALFSAELYDPAAGTWTAASRSLNAARSTHTATLLPSGQVLVAAGYYVNNNVWLSSAEVYDSTAGPITLVQPKMLPGGACQFAFTGVPNRTNTMLATTDLGLPLSNWTELGAVPEFAPGLFLFSDPQATNHSQRFYRVRSP